MLSQTLKTSIKVILDSMQDTGFYIEKASFNRSIKITAAEVVKGANAGQGRTYTFTINGGGILLNIEDGFLGVSQIIKDIEMFKLPKFFRLLQWEETSYTKQGEVYVYNQTNIKHESQFFVCLFKVMKERVYFTVQTNGTMLDCYYIDGKVFYVDETEDEYKLMGTSLFQLFKSHGNHYVCTVSSLLDQFNYASFVDDQERIAVALNKTFVKYRFDQVV